MGRSRILAANIVDIIDEFLLARGISVPCEDDLETKDRLESNGNELGLYGSEYWELVQTVEDEIDRG